MTSPDAFPVTRAEISYYQQTSTNSDVMSFINELSSMYDDRIRATDFGTTPQGHWLPLLVLSSKGGFTPEDATKAGLPVVLIQCGIHAGEVEGKEAALMLARDLLAGHHGDILSRLTLLIVPLFNADGNDNMTSGNRKLDIGRLCGQLGPEIVGTRENAAGINLNRDYMRQEGAEMRLMQSRVCHPWNPHLVIDCHTTNGSIHRFAMTYDIPHVPESGRREPIDYMRNRFCPEVQASVRAQERLESFWYGNFIRDEGGKGAGWITYPHHPRFGGNYRGLTNRLDLLLETYSYLPFSERVRTTYAWLRECLHYVANHGDEIQTLLAQCQEPPRRVALSHRLETFEGMQATILTRSPYTLAGAPIEVQVPYFGYFVGENEVTRPLAYAVPASVGEHLSRHGLVIDAPQNEIMLDAEIALVKKKVIQGGRDILEASSSSYLNVELSRRRCRLPQGWRLVYTAQSRGAIAVYLCEAGSDDGLLTSGLLESVEPGSEFPAWRVHGVSA